MKKIISIGFAVALVLMLVYVSACKKKTQDATPNDGLTSESNEAQSEWDDVLKLSENAMNAVGQSQRASASDSSITFSTISEGNYIGQITIDFGSGMVCGDGKTRSGQIIIKYTGKYRAAGTIIQSSTNNYFVNGKQILGYRTVTNTNGTVYNVVDSGASDGSGYAQIVYPDQTITTWKSTRTRTWTQGTSTIGILSDDVYSVTGTASGVSRAGKAYAMTITDLIIKLECFYTYYIYMPAGGTISIQTTDGTRSVNYGNGISCDRNVTYTGIDGKAYELTL